MSGGVEVSSSESGAPLLNMHIYKHNPKKLCNEPQPYSYRVMVHCMTFWDCLSLHICMFRGFVTSTMGVRCVTLHPPDAIRS